MRKGLGKRKETLEECVVRVVRLKKDSLAVKAGRTGRKRGQARATDVWKELVSIKKKVRGTQKSRCHCPSLRTIQRQLKRLREQERADQLRVRKRRRVPVESVGVTNSQLYFYDRVF